jgi:hypothetical protein
LELRDLIVTPIFLMIIYAVAFMIRPLVTDEVNRIYFLPSITIHLIGALALGFIYQFYYSGGDTYNFHTHGSRHIWTAFMESPESGFKLLFGDGVDQKGIYKYSSRIPFYRDSSSFVIIRIAAFFDLFTFSSYSSTALLFAILSIVGSWMLYLVFYEEWPHLHRRLALACLFIPSVFFWGSGLLKDTITLAFLGMATFCIKKLFIKGRLKIGYILLAFLSLYIIYSVKKYILLCYLPAIFLWIFSVNLSKVNSKIFKIMMFPFVMIIAGGAGYFAIQQVAKDDPRYALSQIGHTAQITAYDIAFQTGRDAGSTYTLGDLNGSFSSMIRLAPQAINVSLFRPYLWEVRNPLMLMSALESVFLILFTIYVLYRCGALLPSILINPYVIFCLIFSITFSFAVGISTFNFGTLSRYKIPLLPFYCVGLILMLDQANNARKLSALDLTE